MSIYFFLYPIYIILLFFIWFLIYKKHKNYFYWKYLFISVIFWAFWLLFYFLSFITTYNKDILLYFSRLLYFLSLVWFYGMIFYASSFLNKYNKRVKTVNYYITVIIIILFFISIFSDLVIKDMIYDNNALIYYEEFGILFNFYNILYLLSPFLFCFFAYKKNKTLVWISKLRFRYIIMWYWIFNISIIFFLGFLPIIWIWILQKEQILFFTSFLLWIWYSIYKYHTFNIKIWIWKIIIFLLSIFYSLFLVNILKYYYLNLDNAYAFFWWISNEFWLIDTLWWIIIFFIWYNFLNKALLWNNSLIIFEKRLNNLRKYIPYITNLSELNHFLKNKYKNLFKIKNIQVKLYWLKDTNKELYKYFSKDTTRDLFINDIVFIEENKYKFNLESLKEEIWEKIYLIFPLINNKRELIWTLELGSKPFGDQYYSEEIKILKDFANYLVWHLKYLEIYSEINELNVNLDKKVDEKTIEYNNLLSKQKEFISMSSHEIKTPVASSIFQIDCLIDDFKTWELSQDKIKDDLNILNSQLLKLWELVNKIFKVQEYDIKKIELFIEKINLKNLFLKEIETFKKINPRTKINFSIDDEISFIEIDKVQFKQVIDNLLNNAIKFSNKSKSIIYIKINKKNDNLIISIEDNWKWFENIDTKTIFDKYISWDISTVWIWMWLYLCKKIVEMHNWKIKARDSIKLLWAEFIIKIPIEYKKTKNLKID